MLKVGSNWNWRSGTAVQYAGSIDLVKGLDGFGSGLAAVDLVDDPRRADFALTRLSFTRLTRFGERWSVRLDVLGQQTAYVLPYGERFKIGGDRLGRGFEVAEIAGDQGLGAKVEGRSRLLQCTRIARPRVALRVLRYRRRVEARRTGPRVRRDGRIRVRDAGRSVLGHARARQTAHPRRCRGSQGSQAVRGDRDLAVASRHAASCLARTSRYG